MSLEAYSVAVRLRLVNEVSSGLTAISGHFHKAGLDAKEFQAELHKIKMMGMVGFGMTAAGAFGLAMLKGPLDEAKKYQIELAKFESLGFGSVINKQADIFASGLKTIGTSARDNMTIVGDAMAVFKDLNEAKMVSPLMAKMKFANEVIFGAGGGDRDKKLMDMMKVAEFRGGTRSPEEFAKQVNFAQQAIAGSRNRVDSSAMLQALKTGGVGISRRTNESFYLGAEPLIQEFGGMRYGTGVMSLYQNLVQAKGSITSQQELYRLGLLDKKMVQFNSLGMLKKALPGAFLGSRIQEEEGELALLTKVLLPAFAKNGITSDEDVIREIGRIAGNRTGSNLLARTYQQRVKLQQQTDANYHAENLDQSSSRASGMLAGKEADLTAKWATAMKDLGVTILPAAITALEGLTALMKGVAYVAETFPHITQGLTVSFAALSLALLGGGVSLGVTAGLRGLTLALPGVSTALSGVIASFIGPVGLVIAIAAVTYAIGTLAAKMLEFDKIHKDEINAKGQHVTTTNSMTAWLLDHALGLDTKMRWLPETVSGPMGGRQPVQVHTQINLDGHKIATVVTKHQARGMSQPQGGVTFADSMMSMPSPANPY
jgi:hypothetical protein